MIRPTTKSDMPSIMQMIEQSGHFDSIAIELVESQLNEHFDGGEHGIWLTADDGGVVGVAYCDQEKIANGTWNLLMLWTDPLRQRQGHGQKLVSHILDRLRKDGARLLIVETSGLDDFSPARAFYAKCGFQLEARIRNFFDDGDDKIIYTLTI